uniref:Uncharacterized protein n=1 Tax=Arundo donax TaxID=35708 RepID=A0A0A8YHG4_ARUDO
MQLPAPGKRHPRSSYLSTPAVADVLPSTSVKRLHYIQRTIGNFLQYSNNSTSTRRGNIESFKIIKRAWKLISMVLQKEKMLITGTTAIFK